MTILRTSLLLLLALCVHGSAFAHGLTLCVGTLHYGDSTTVALDLRFGVGVLHKFVDPNDDAVISNEEWTSSTIQLNDLFAKGIRLRWNDSSTTPSALKLNLTSGAEVQVLATLDVPTTSTELHLGLPALRRFPGAPPMQLSVWYNSRMVRNPELLWFDQELAFDRTRK